MLNQRRAFVTAPVLRDNRVVHDFKRDAVDEVIGDFAFLLAAGIRDGECGAQVVSLLLKVLLEVVFFFLALGEGDGTGFDAGGDVVGFFFERGF